VTEHWRVQPDFMNSSGAQLVFLGSVSDRAKQLRSMERRWRKAYPTPGRMRDMAERLANAYEAAADALVKVAMEGFEP
jgi:hypothetical protein